MKIKYLKNKKLIEIEYRPSVAVDRLSASLGVLWNEGFRSAFLDSRWEELERTGSVKYMAKTKNNKIVERHLQLLSYEPSEREKRGVFGEPIEKKKAKDQTEYTYNYSTHVKRHSILMS